MKKLIPGHTFSHGFFLVQVLCDCSDVADTEEVQFVNGVHRFFTFVILYVPVSYNNARSHPSSLTLIRPIFFFDACTAVACWLR